MSNPPITPMTLGGLFDSLFKLIARTWKRTLAVASIILVVPAIVMVLGLNAFFVGIVEIAQESRLADEAEAEALFMILANLAWFVLALLLFAVGTVSATLGATVIGCAELSGQSLSWQEGLRTSLSIRLARLMGQYVLQGIAIGTLFLVPYALLIAAIVSESIELGLIAGMLLVCFVGVIIYLATAWAFTVPAIGWEGTRIIEAFRRSWTLVKGNWWRVFGILLLMGIILNFAISLVMTPVYLIALWDFFILYFETLAAGGVEPDPSQVLGVMSSLGFGIGLLAGLSSILQVMVAPLYVAVLYFDLRARQGEFLGPPSATAV